MRLALNFQRVDPTRGGAETYVADLSQRLVRAGHGVDLYAESWAEGVLPAEVNCVAVPVSGGNRLARIRSFARNSEEALAKTSYDCTVGMINTWSQDVLIPQGGVHPGSLEANSKRFEAGWQRQLYKLGKTANPKYWTYRAIERKQYNPARETRVIAVSQMVKEHLQRYHQVPKSRIYVIPNAIDADRIRVSQPGAVRCAFRNKLALAPNDLVGLFVAHNFALKGLKPLLHALAERKRLKPKGRPIQLLVCGGGSIPPYRRLAQSLGLGENVHWVGYTPDIRPCFWSSDFFVLPTYYDPCSLVVFEALACGLPVITTSSNGASEVMTDNRQGYVLTAPDALGELVGALDRMTIDVLRRAMSNEAAALGREQTMDRHVTRLIKVFEEVAASKTRRTPHSLRSTSRRSLR